jgi:lysine-specific permease
MSETQHSTQLQRKLSARHLNMIAIGGSIGTGLFLASGATIANAGPGGALLAYALIGVMIYFLMTSLGELATHNPTSGAFFTYGTKYVEGGFGFALGWNYWYNWAITVAFELVATPELKILRNNSGRCSRICGTCATPKPNAREIAMISRARRSR